MIAARCEPPQGRPLSYRYWLRLGDQTDTDVPAVWHPGFWTWGGQQRAAEDVAREGWRCIAPVTPPDIVRGLVDALEAANQFITNGIELGYIRMPNPSTPDSALKTPGIVRAALKAAKEAGV